MQKKKKKKGRGGGIGKGRCVGGKEEKKQGQRPVERKERGRETGSDDRRRKGNISQEWQ